MWFPKATARKSKTNTLNPKCSCGHTKLCKHARSGCLRALYRAQCSHLFKVGSSGLPAQSLPNNWAAANGGVTNGGLRGVWPPFPEIGRNRPFSPFFCLFRRFPEGAKSTWKIQKTEEKGLFPQISSDLLKPPSLKPPFAALQNKVSKSSFSGQTCTGAQQIYTY